MAVSSFDPLAFFRFFQYDDPIGSSGSDADPETNRKG